MAFTPVEWIALILIVVVIIKIGVLLINPKSWMGFAKGLWKNTWLTAIICLILAGVVLWYLLVEITIVQILAVTAFVALLMCVGLAGYIPDLVKTYERQIKSKSIWQNGTWFYTLIWIALMAWGAWVLFA